MKRLALILALVFVVAVALPAMAGKGNDAPSGAHYNLNLIGVPKTKSADMNGNNGHRIFVPLWGNCKIMLTEADSFSGLQVLDANGTDGTAAFALPNPDPENTGTTSYSVYARTLGKPGGTFSMKTCATYLVDSEIYCSMYNVVDVTGPRGKGKSTFHNVTRELLYMYVETADKLTHRVPIFDDAFEDYFWDYDGYGLKLLQLRFYELPTTVPDYPS
jgi:hypothetical protein